MKRNGTIILLTILAIAGCRTVPSEGEFKTVQAALQSPAAFKEARTRCEARVRTTPVTATTRNLIAMMNTTQAKFAATFCQRFVGDIASGRLSPEDFRRAYDPNADSSNLIRVMQGR